MSLISSKSSLKAHSWRTGLLAHPSLLHNVYLLVTHSQVPTPSPQAKVDDESHRPDSGLPGVEPWCGRFEGLEWRRVAVKPLINVSVI
jgi:hypothetical protein